MIDSELVTRLQELHESGNETAITQELNQNGGWARLLSIAAHGLENRPKRQVRPKQALIPGMEFPTWWPADSWAAFVQMRKAKKQPLTERAVVLIVNAITELKAKGHDPAAVVDQSIRKGWTDIYPLKDFVPPSPALRVVGGSNWDINQEG